MENQTHIGAVDVQEKLRDYGIGLGEQPYKLYGVTTEGNGHEDCIFLGTFSTIKECEQEPIADGQYHGRYVDLEEDY